MIEEKMKQEGREGR